MNSFKSGCMGWRHVTCTCLRATHTANLNASVCITEARKNTLNSWTPGVARFLNQPIPGFIFLMSIHIDEILRKT